MKSSLGDGGVAQCGVFAGGENKGDRDRECEIVVV
jgi:hypothetical protein